MTREGRRTPRLLVIFGVLGLVLGGGATARGEAVEAPVVEAPALPPVRPPIWEVGAGIRTRFIKDPGFDPFSTNDAFVDFSLWGTRELVRSDRLVFVAGLALDIGGANAEARGAASALTLTQVSAVAEARYQPATRFYLFGRLAPGLLHGRATIDDGSGLGTGQLATTFETFSLDASAGAALCLGALGMARVGAWLLADGGYAFVPSQTLVLAPSLGNANQTGTLDLGTLAPRGGFFRISIALGF
jgi:hypothetical protein